MNHGRSGCQECHRVISCVRAGLVSGAGALVLAGAVPALAQTQRAAPPAAVVFDGVTVVDVEHGRLVPDQRVVIVGTRIQAVGGRNAVQLPKSAQRVAARGKYLIPGLWDMHAHPERETDVFYPLLLANGVTGIRDAGSPVPLDTLRRWRQEVLAGTRVGPPRQILSGQSIDGPVGMEPCERSRRMGVNTCVADSADAVHYVDSLKAAGADMIKPHNALPRELYFVIAAEARRLGIPFGGHPGDLTAVEASDSGASIVDHFPSSLFERPGSEDPMTARMSCVGPSASVQQCQPIAERLRRNNTWLEWDALSDAFSGLFDQQIRKFWEGSLRPGKWLRASGRPRADSVGEMQIVQRVNLPIVAGTDGSGLNGWRGMRNAPLGLRLHGMLAGYVAEGLTPLSALQAATLNPAKMWRATDSLGTVAAGKLADLVLLDANPLADITNTTAIRAVVANGRYFDRTALDTWLAEARRIGCSRMLEQAERVRRESAQQGQKNVGQAKVFNCPTGASPAAARPTSRVP